MVAVPIYKKIKGGITAPLGFKAAGIHSGIKRIGKDLCLIYSKKEALSAGVFTRNKFEAAPVRLAREHLKTGKARAIIINSGNANACTGARGYQDARRIVDKVSRELGINEKEVLIASTGVIGKFLPVERIETSIKVLVRSLNRKGNVPAREAIMTTDTFPKEEAVSFLIDGVEVKLGGMAKGSGMISPLLATMLCFITSDVSITLSALRQALKDCVEKSFNRITVDGDMSTNDTVIILANGISGNPVIEKGSRNLEVFKQALFYLTSSLAKMVVKDGEGATKVIEIKVKGARSEEEAKRIALHIANSNLVKTSLSAPRPNWGRIGCACGSSGARIEPAKVSILIGDEYVMRKGCAASYDARKMRRVLRSDEIKVTVNLNLGGETVSVLTTDLTEEYVRINRRYT